MSPLSRISLRLRKYPNRIGSGPSLLTKMPLFFKSHWNWTLTTRCQVLWRMTLGLKLPPKMMRIKRTSTARSQSQTKYNFTKVASLLAKMISMWTSRGPNSVKTTLTSSWIWVKISLTWSEASPYSRTTRCSPSKRETKPWSLECWSESAFTRITLKT